MRGKEVKMKSRIIFNTLYKTEEWGSLDNQQKVLAIYLMTNESIGLVPAYRLNKREVSFWLNIDVGKIESNISKLESLGIYLVGQYIVVCNTFSAYIYHTGEKNRNRNAMIKEFRQLPIAVQEKLLSLNFPVEYDNDIPYGSIEGTLDGTIYGNQNKKQEIINNKSKTKIDLEEERKKLYERMHWN